VYTKASFYKGTVKFIEEFKRILRLPLNVKKTDIDSLRLSFIVEKNGKLSNCAVIGNVQLGVDEALKIALYKCGEWNPSKLYGVPVRAKMELYLQVFGDDNRGRSKMALYSESLMTTE
jgi:hypothetical protein